MKDAALRGPNNVLSLFHGVKKMKDAALRGPKRPQKCFLRLNLKNDSFIESGFYSKAP